MTSQSEILKDLHLSGIGTASGGRYRLVRISGVGAVKGDVEAEQLLFSGAGAIKGNATVQKVNLSGTASIKGNLIAEHLEVSGASMIHGSVCSKSVHISGSANLNNNVEADQITASGTAHVRGSIRANAFHGSGCFNIRHNVDATDFESSGAFKINGRVAAARIQIRPSGSCTVNMLLGETISVIDDPDQSRRNHEQRRLTAEQIAAPEIALELTTAETVRGRVVRIGPGCEIDTVEYSESLDVDPNATVKHTKYTGMEKEPYESP